LLLSKFPEQALLFHQAAGGPWDGEAEADLKQRINHDWVVLPFSQFAGADTLKRRPGALPGLNPLLDLFFVRQ